MGKYDYFFGNAKLPKELIKNLEIKKLEQVLENELDTEKYNFLGLGKLYFNYNVKVVEGDSMAATLVGNDHSKILERGNLKNSYINNEIPLGSTHYFLGEGESDEELYINHKENSHSRDIFSIVYLKEI